jgi:hypothetical protein
MDELALGLGYSLDCPEALEVGWQHVSHDSNLGKGDPGKLLDFAQGMHPHFEHGDVVCRIKVHDRQGQAELSVQVSRRTKHVEFLAEEPGDDFLGCRLPHAARNSNHAHLVLASPGAGKADQGLARGSDLNDWMLSLGIDALRDSLNERAVRATAECVADEGMAVLVFAPKRDEKVTGVNCA